MWTDMMYDDRTNFMRFRYGKGPRGLIGTYGKVQDRVVDKAVTLTIRKVKYS